MSITKRLCEVGIDANEEKMQTRYFRRRARRKVHDAWRKAVTSFKRTDAELTPLAAPRLS